MSKDKKKWKYDLSIGCVVLSPRYEQFIKMIKSIYKCIDLDVSYEICVFMQEFDQDGKEKIQNEINRLKNSGISVSLLSLEKNVGFCGSWNLLVQIMEGEYHLMMQDDMEFANNPKEKISDFIKYKNDNNLDILNLNGCTSYTDWMHIEHSSLRRDIGDYPCYPRYFDSLFDQGSGFEVAFGEMMIKNNKKIGIYKKSLGGCQRTPDISYCHLQTKLNHLSPEEKSKFWENPMLLKNVLNENNNK